MQGSPKGLLFYGCIIIIMSHLSKSLVQHLRLMSPESLARPSDFRYGKAIFQRGGVEFIEHSATRVEAWVGGLEGSVVEGGSQRRRTQLFTERGELAWHCAGNPKTHQVFCKHCVALALAILAADL